MLAAHADSHEGVCPQARLTGPIMHDQITLEPLPTANQVRADMAAETRERTVAKALVALTPTVLLYLASVVAVIAAPIWAWPVLMPLCGLIMSIMFVVAHDAAHDSLTPYPWLNGLIGRVLFIPAGHNFSGWVHAHNHVHHGWTNFQPRDYVWCPLSLEQYRQRSKLGQWWVRFGRWWPAFGLYYTIDILWGRIILPQPDVKQAKARRRWHLDNVVLLAGVIAQGAATLAVARAMGVTTHPVLLIVGAQFVPFFVCQWLVGFLTYLHHTHPSIPWFQDLHQWTFYMGQICGTTHVQFPGRVNRWIHNIMEHNAHHVDPKIPLYHLIEAQEQIEDHHQPVVTAFGTRSFLYTQRVCQLYDFENHTWLSYDGRTTSSRTVSEELLRRAALNHARQPVVAA